MRLRVGLTGSQRWALQGIAQALQRAEGPAFEPVLLAREDLRAQGALDAVVVLAADAAEAARVAAALPPQLPVLWLGEAAAAASSAPTGQLAADVGDEVLAAALHALASGLSVHDGAHRRPPVRDAAELSEPLTPRELEVLELMAKGLANREIAQALGISSHTAKFHVAQILEKAGAATRTEAVRQGLRLGLIGL
jgi:DNA-binding NarL/FixJ family response regulator